MTTNTGTTTLAATVSPLASLTPLDCARTRNTLRTGQLLSNPKVAARIAQVPQLYQALYKRVIQGKGSPREAIQAQCLECVCWQRKEVTLCTDNACPLYPYRPYQRDGTDGL